MASPRRIQYDEMKVSESSQDTLIGRQRPCRSSDPNSFCGNFRLELTDGIFESLLDFNR